jgi:hypothetical protein
MHFGISDWEVMPAVKARLDAIRSCTSEDKYGWMVKI